MTRLETMRSTAYSIAFDSLTSAFEAKTTASERPIWSRGRLAARCDQNVCICRKAIEV